MENKAGNGVTLDIVTLVLMQEKKHQNKAEPLRQVNIKNNRRDLY